MKKVIGFISVFVACFAFLFVITSCDNSNSNTDNDKQQTVTPVNPESSSETKPSNPDITVDPGHDNDQLEGHVHRFYETYIANEVSPTCTQNGSYDIVGICLDCKMEVREHKIIEKLGHDLIHHDAVEPTCTQNGWEEYDTCSRCDYTTYKRIPALGHDYHKTEFEATYDSDGYILYECSRCGNTYNEVTSIAQVCEKLSFGGGYNGSYSVTAKSTDISGDVVIPETYNGIPVARIEDYAFDICTVTNISLPNSVTSIGDHAFANASFANVYYDGTIEDWCNITFSNSDSNPMVYATNFYILDENGDIEYNGKNYKLLTELEIPSTVTSIGNYQFYGFNYLTNVTIPDSVTSIGHEAFCNCSSLTSITIPDSVTSIGSAAFNKAEITYIRISSVEEYLSIDGLVNLEGTRHLINDETNEEITELVIPNSVTSIGGSAFYRCSSLTSITIPDSVTSIGGSAFYRCSSLTNVEIGNGVTSIGIFAFEYCSSLISVTIGDSVTSIGGWAFSKCPIKEAIIPAIACDSIKNSKLEKVTITSGETIPSSAFSSCASLTSVTIGDSVTSIGECAFYNCSSLTSVTISDNVTSIGKDAFYNSQDVYYNSALKDTYIRISSVEEYLSISIDVLNNLKGTRHLINDKTNEEIIEIVIPNSVTSIEDSAFYKCGSLTSITIGDSVTSIGSWAFSNCSSLTSIIIPDSITSIGDFAFEYCSSLISITIPDSITYIGEGAFKNSLVKDTYIRILSVEKYLSIDGLGKIMGIRHLINDEINEEITELVIPNSVTSIGESAFVYCSSLISITIPDSVTSIGEYAFYNCTSLTSITIPESVTSIGNRAFEGCYRLVEVINKSSLSITLRSTYNGYIGIYAKQIIADESDSKLSTDENGFITYNDGTDIWLVNYIGNCTEIVIPNNVTKINDYAFYNCSSLTSIIIPDSVTSIGERAFYDCSSLTSIIIPDSVTSIGERAFYNCSSLTSIIVNSNNKVFDSRNNCNAIIDTSTNTLIVGCKNTTIPDSVTSIGNYAFAWCSSLTSITIPNGVTSIGEDAFEYCSSLTSITIPDSITSIGNYAFYNCSSLTSITIPDGVTSIYWQAFYNCSSLTTITIPDSVTRIDSQAFYNCSSLTNVYYKGTSSYTDTITSIENYNQSLTRATWYYFTSNGVNETVSGNWWYYDTDGKTIIEKVIS